MKNIYSLIYTSFKDKSNKIALTTLALLSAQSSFAQNEDVINIVNWTALFSNTLFNVLFGIVVLLVIAIAILGSILTNVGQISLEKQKAKDAGKTIGAITLIAMLSSSMELFAQGSSTASSTLPVLPDSIFHLMLTVIGFELLIVIILLSLIKTLIKSEDEVIVEEPSFLDKLNASVPLENEADVMTDHVYDGIRELDNDLPPWWKYGFYLTIVVSFIYTFHYHFGEGDLQKAEFEKTIVAAKLAKEEFAKMNANNVNENNAEMLTDAAEIAKGGETYQGMCFACHGKFGEGGVGPNLTDEYWVHGGSMKDIFSSIKYGWPNKGMKSWEADLSPKQIHQISSFIMSLKGTNPKNAKEAQGDLYTEVILEVNDSLQTDSIPAVTDSLK